MSVRASKPARVIIGLTLLATVYGAIVTFIALATQDPSEGANIGGGIGILGTILAAAALGFALIGGRGQPSFWKTAMTSGAAIMLVPAIALLLFVRPFD